MDVQKGDKVNWMCGGQVHRTGVVQRIQPAGDFVVTFGRGPGRLKFLIRADGRLYTDLQHGISGFDFGVIEPAHVH